MGTEGRTLRCIGDPYGGDCLAPATEFGFGALPNPEGAGEPMMLAMPCCKLHAPIVGDWLVTHSPLDVHLLPIDALDGLQAELRSLGGDLWLYTHQAA